MLARPRAVSHRIAEVQPGFDRADLRARMRACAFRRGHLTPVLTRPADHPAESLRRPLFHVLPFCAPIIPSPSRGPRRRLPLLLSRGRMRGRPINRTIRVRVPRRRGPRPAGRRIGQAHLAIMAAPRGRTASGHRIRSNSAGARPSCLTILKKRGGPISRPWCRGIVTARPSG